MAEDDDGQEEEEVGQEEVESQRRGAKRERRQQTKCLSIGPNCQIGPFCWTFKEVCCCMGSCSTFRTKVIVQAADFELV